MSLTLVNSRIILAVLIECLEKGLLWPRVEIEWMLLKSLRVLNLTLTATGPDFAQETNFEK